MDKQSIQFFTAIVSVTLTCCFLIHIMGTVDPQRIINGKFSKNYTSAVIERMNWALKEYIYKEKVKLEQIREDRLHRLHFLQSRKNEGKEVSDELIIIKAKHTEERPNYKIEAVGNYLKNNSTEKKKKRIILKFRPSTTTSTTTTTEEVPIDDNLLFSSEEEEEEASPETIATPPTTTTQVTTTISEATTQEPPSNNLIAAWRKASKQDAENFHLRMQQRHPQSQYAVNRIRHNGLVGLGGFQQPGFKGPSSDDNYMGPPLESKDIARKWKKLKSDDE